MTDRKLVELIILSEFVCLSSTQVLPCRLKCCDGQLIRCTFKRMNLSVCIRSRNLRVLIDDDVLKLGPKFKVNFKCSWWNCRTNSHRTKNIDQIPSSSYIISTMRYSVLKYLHFPSILFICLLATCDRLQSKTCDASSNRTTSIKDCMQ